MTAPVYTRQAAAALEQAALAEHDFPAWLAVTLATAAARLGSSYALIAGRPGSWEADLVERLVSGTVGWDDEHLPDYAAPDEEAPADQRVTQAREYLDAIRPYKVSHRPHSMLVREAAELRRQLGQVLDYIAEGDDR